jgi:uncharacterized membrane-anchored protein
LQKGGTMKTMKPPETSPLGIYEELRRHVERSAANDRSRRMWLISRLLVLSVAVNVVLVVLLVR